MKETPILMCGEMVRAILKTENQKTQTRRIINPQPIPIGKSSYGGTRSGWQWKPESLRRGWNDDDKDPYNTNPLAMATLALGCESPYGQVGDRLWVRETFALCSQVDGNGFPSDRPFKDFTALRELPKFGRISADFLIYRADGGAEFCDDGGGFLSREDGSAGSIWKPSIHMHREYSRLTLEIVKIRVERVRDISCLDAFNEGCDGSSDCRDVLADYKTLWESINGKDSWDVNPWVWVIEFKRL